jgi:2-iminobutanoate/2-iminopropanoate deaminase
MPRHRLRFLAILTTMTLTATDTAQAQLVFHARPDATVPFSPAVEAGNLVFLSGMIGAAPDGSIPPAMADQARYAMDGLGASLKLAGLSFDDVAKCTVMLADMKTWGAFNRVYATYFKPGQMPARSAFGATGLAFNAGVEVECIAYRSHPVR